MGKKPDWVSRMPKQKWYHEMIQEVGQGKDISQMFWWAIWLNGKTDLIAIEFDTNNPSPRRGYATQSYLWELE